jgi:hypothetical protein
MTYRGKALICQTKNIVSVLGFSRNAFILLRNIPWRDIPSRGKGPSSKDNGVSHPSPRKCGERGKDDPFRYRNLPLCVPCGIQTGSDMINWRDNSSLLGRFLKEGTQRVPICSLRGASIALRRLLYFCRRRSRRSYSFLGQSISSGIIVGVIPWPQRALNESLLPY